MGSGEVVRPDCSMPDGTSETASTKVTDNATTGFVIEPAEIASLNGEHIAKVTVYC